jgi:hypothetical protein
MTTNTTHHVLNNRQWLHFMQSPTFDEKYFSAIILTGWSRFDHFMPLCDILPTAYPSLIYSLYVLNTDKFLADDPFYDCETLLKSVGQDHQLCKLLPGNNMRRKKTIIFVFYIKVFLFFRVYHLYPRLFRKFKIF